MRFNVFKNTVLIFILTLISCGSSSKSEARSLEPGIISHNKIQDTSKLSFQNNKQIIVGANQTEDYLTFLKGKRVGIVANQTSVIFKTPNKQIASTLQTESNNASYTHLIDSLVSLQVDVKKVFAPEHGFRGKADAGEVVKDGIDIKTGLPIVSLYGKNKKPSPKQLENIDLMIFDIQDVGARFYTYISSLHYVMEACAEAKIPLLILDRPNPNGHYTDGPVLEIEHKSFVGMHPIPVIHGMTIGEYAKMINGEKWLTNTTQCELNIITIKNYTHLTPYKLPIKPSPNLPNAKAINLYPSLCFFEGTNVSAGRGTEKQFQIYGSPFLPQDTYSFTPKANEGAKYPKHENKVCYGEDLTSLEVLDYLNLDYLIKAYNNTTEKSVFFNAFFTKLAGTKTLRQQIESGLSFKQIKASWTPGLEAYNKMRKAYLLYN